jgi:ubiquinol-cytochrome c reductase cytochrome b subunit
VIDVALLGYVGAQPTTPTLVILGQVATFMYFAMFLLLPFVSRKEERWLRARGLPKAVQELLESEAAKAGGDRK